MYRVARAILVAAVIGLCFVIGMGGLACCTSCGTRSPTTISIPPAFPVPYNNYASWTIPTITPGTCTLSWNVTGPAGTTVNIQLGVGVICLSGSKEVQCDGVYTLTATSTGGSVTRTIQAQ